MHHVHVLRELNNCGTEDLARGEMLAIRWCAWTTQALTEQLTSMQGDAAGAAICVAVAQLNASIESISADAMVGGNVTSRAAQVKRAFCLARSTVERFLANADANSGTLPSGIAFTEAHL